MLHVSQNTPEFDHLNFYRETLQTNLTKVHHGRFKLHLPRPLERLRRLAGMHFHFEPEMFIQTGGLTDFTFPKEKIRLLAGEALVVPRGLPHNEIARNTEKDFLNVVVTFPREGISIHSAVKNDRGNPQGFGLEYFKTEKGRQVEQYFDDIANFYHSDNNVKKSAETTMAIQGLFQAALATLLLITKEVETPDRATEHVKISECRKYVLSRIYDPALSVKKLAGQIHCAPDYLSHLFTTETGERLTDFIHQERIALAKRHLQNPALNIKEIAWSCGFADQGYFSRLFKRLTGETPKAFRKKFRTTVFRAGNA
jgi:AraC-like DNA-binding protein/mannose-6-phosphate isomerase-like protein (cupin superfamily)